MAAAEGGAELAEAAESVPTAEPGRDQLFGFIVDTFLEKICEAGSYPRFATCYSRLYKAQPELTRCIYDQMICQLQASFREEIQELRQEGNLEALLGKLDKLVEDAKDQAVPAWRPSGIPEDDVRSAVVPYLLKQRRLLQQSLREKEEANARLAETVLAGRRRIADLQEEIQRRKADWQAVAQEGREIADGLQELQ